MKSVRSSKWGVLALPLCLSACQTAPFDTAWQSLKDLSQEWTREDPAPPDTTAESIDPSVYQRAGIERSEFFEREVERLRADLRQAEESIVALESGLRGFHSRADAVSAVAEARIGLERVSPTVSWREDSVTDARSKIAEASRQLDAGHVGAAVFFASRAQRITDTLRAEAQLVSAWPVRRWSRGSRVHMRAGPSTRHQVVDVLIDRTPVYPERSMSGWTLVRTPDGRVGWVHDSLLSAS